MAENKKSFILYADLVTVIRKLIEKDRLNKTNYTGELFLHILEYVNDNNPIPVDFIVDMAFEPIKQQLKRDLNEWGTIKKDRSKSGALGNLKRWNIDLYDKVIAEEMELSEAESIAKHRRATKSIANVAVTVNDNVTVNVNDTVYDYYIVNGKIEKGNVCDWYFKNHRLQYEAVVMQLDASKFEKEIQKGLREHFISGFSFNDYRHIPNAFAKRIRENITQFIPKKPQLVR
jgi:hypothetical protein